MANKDRKPRADRRPRKETEPVEKRELEAVREEEQALTHVPDEAKSLILMPEGVQKKGPNVFIQSLTVIANPLRSFLDPVKKVCYEPLAAHYDAKYREPHGRYATLILAFDLSLLFILGSMAVLGIFAYFVLPAFPTLPIVRVENVSPRTIVSGEEASFVVSIANDSDKNVGCADLVVHLPADTVITEPPAPTGATECTVDPSLMGRLESETERQDVLVVPLGEMTGHRRDLVSFKARIYGPTGGLKEMVSELRYWEVARTSPSRVSARTEWEMADSALAVGFTLPEKVIRGRSHAVTVTYANDGSSTLPGVSLKVATPTDFVPIGWNPAPTKPNEWYLGDLEAGARGDVTIHGYFRTAGAPSAPTFVARAFVTDDGKALLAEMARANADPAASGFELEQVVNEPAGRTSLYAGEEMTVTVRYRNGGDRPIKDMVVILDPGSTQYLASSSPEDLRWDATDMAEFAEVAPGAEGELRATLKLKEEIGPQLVGVDEFAGLRLTAKAEYVLEDDPTRPVRVDTAPVDLPIATKVGLKAAAIYYTKDGDQLGIGPLPPKVGEATRFRVFLQVTTTTNALDGARVEATLAPNVAWTGRASVTAGEAIDHLQTSNRIRWDIGQVPPFADGSGLNVGASFELELTPAAEDAGKEPPLLTDIKISGTDAVTGLKLVAVAEDVTTALPYDEMAKGKGVVVEGVE